MVKVLNLYAGVGGNRNRWQGVEVTAVERDSKIAAVYQSLYPQDHVVVGDAHQYLLDHYAKYDLIWSSPPCQSHTRFILSGRNRVPKYPDFRLYEEVVFLKQFFTGLWVVENVDPYYEPLMAPKKVGRHLFWSNFRIGLFQGPDFPGDLFTASAPELQEWLGIFYEGSVYCDGNHDPRQALRNCVHPAIGEYIFNCALGVDRRVSSQGTLNF